MAEFLYNFLSSAIDSLYWRGDLLGEEHLPTEGPAIFAANHLNSLGPIGVVCSLPMRLYPWVISEMIDPDQCAEYLNADFIEPTWRLKPPLSLSVSMALSKIIVPIFKSLDCIPVYRHFGNLQDTFEMSLSMLKKTRFLLIFPEDPDREKDPISEMRPFMKGIVRLGERFYAETGKIISFFPVAVHQSRKVMLGEPISYDPLNRPIQERHRIKDMLEERIRGMYLELCRLSSSSSQEI